MNTKVCRNFQHLVWLFFCKPYLAEQSIEKENVILKMHKIMQHRIRYAKHEKKDNLNWLPWIIEPTFGDRIFY